MRAVLCSCHPRHAQCLPSPVHGTRSQPPPFAHSSHSNGSRRLSLGCCVSRLDDSLPPPELHLQALIDACQDAALPGAQAAAGWLLLPGAASPGSVSVLVPWERAWSQRALTMHSSVGSGGGCPSSWETLQEFPPTSPYPVLLQRSHALCLSFPIYNADSVCWHRRGSVALASALAACFGEGGSVTPADRSSCPGP